ncbi:orotate phosphoribosyltransferase [Candidatus Bipolaricaulota bacterium]|nr:orotate phosphoribosyltransferase [Candidatus Bipolaricaulota bacterium]
MPRSKEIAEKMLKTKAITVNLEEPFVFVSGTVSPVYVDCRKLLSYPSARNLVTEGFHEVLTDKIGLNKVGVIAGGETAGIPYAAFLADRTDKPMIYIRKTTKGYGQDSQIEGVLEKNQKVSLVEDVITDGTTKLKFNIGIRSSGAFMTDCLCVFSYYSTELGLNKGKKRLEKHDIRLHSLVDWDDVLEVMNTKNIFCKNVIQEIRNFLRAPEQWASDKGLE